MEHKLSDILLLTICVVISGSEGWGEIEDFGEAKLDFLRTYAEFEADIPTSPMVRYFISSKDISAKELADAAR